MSRLRRSSPLRAKKPMKRVPIKKRKRRASEFARIYGSKARVEWVKSQPCWITTPICSGEIHNHHTKNGGRGRKADAKTIVPLCEFHHRKLHDLGRRAFEELYGDYADLDWAAENTERRWQFFAEGAA